MKFKNINLSKKKKKAQKNACLRFHVHGFWEQAKLIMAIESRKSLPMVGTRDVELTGNL